MGLADLLKKKRRQILDRWFLLILDTYPHDTAALLKFEKDRFVNPVGTTITREIEILFDELLGEMNSEKIASALENIIRIRTVQDFSPSDAVLFVHRVKRAIQDELAGELGGPGTFEGWLKLESKIDHMSLAAFDIYMACREKIYEIRIREMKKEKERAFQLMARSGIKISRGLKNGD